MRVVNGIAMEHELYKRGQMEWALWKAFALTSMSKAADMPQTFRTRIKRLLEIDRTLKLEGSDAVSGTVHAFAPPPDEESGETLYQSMDAFCLSVGLELLNAGFKQSEVVFLIRHLRTPFEKRFEDILNGPSLISRKNYCAKDYPGYPTYKGERQDLADGRVYVIIRTVEMTEVYPKLAGVQHPIVLEPVFCRGIDALSKDLHALTPYHGRIATILEIASSAQAVASFLKQAPAIKRGRPAKQT